MKIYRIPTARPLGATALVCLFLQASAPPCFAQAADPAPQPPTQQQTVEQLANLAYQQHQQGQYAESISTYLKAYEISKAADILFNVATIYDRKLHERELAADYYRRYIRTPDPSPELVKRATERLTSLKKEAADEQAAKNAAPAPSAAPAPTAAPAPSAVPAGPTAEERADSLGAERTWRTVGIVTGAVGLAGVTASMILGGLAKTSNDKANANCNGSVCASQQGVSDAHDAGTYATASTIAIAGGLAVLALGVTIYVTAPKPIAGSGSIAPGGVTLAPNVGSSGGGLTVAGAF
jgi:tetratricopeptide (TPR) repeat protein